MKGRLSGCESGRTRRSASAPTPVGCSARRTGRRSRPNSPACAADGQQAAWRAAKDIWAGHLVPHHAAYAGWRLAECLLDAGQRRSAEAELAAAYTAAEGHVPLRAAIEGLARRARLALPTDADVDSQPSEEAGDLAPHGLTPRELDVLRLLGTGATNAEIGRRLYMSPKTASVHVSAIIRKLGVTGRVQAATVAERMGLLVDETGVDGDA